MTPRLFPDRPFASSVRLPEPFEVSVSPAKIWVRLRGALQGSVMVLLFLIAAAAPAQPLSTKAQGQSRQAQSQAREDQARAETAIGQTELREGRPHDAQAHCETALKLDPANKAANECLDNAAAMFVDQNLNEPDAKLLSGDKKGAISLASKWASGGAQQNQRDRARKILKKAQSHSPQDIFRTLTPDWLRQVLATIFLLTVVVLFLQGVRRLKRARERGKAANKTTWRFLPLKELPTVTDGPGIATDVVLDALARVGHELRSELWSPELLLLRPTPPATHEPAIISHFLSDSLPTVVLAPPVEELRLEWEHDYGVQLDQAVQNLQLGRAAGIDIGSVARLLLGVVRWFNTGAPVISGVAETTDKSVSIHLAGRGPTKSVSITASTDHAPGISPIELSAERAAFKFLFRTVHPELTNDQIDGLAALRQGAAQFAQYAETVPGFGEDAERRTSSLAKAALNLSFFRASIPTHGFGCSSYSGTAAPAEPKKKPASLNITDEVRQSVLLAEGVAHALAGGEKEQRRAIDCFHELQDWPGSPDTRAFRQQAAYNEAIVWRELKRPGECILHLTELLGEQTPDTVSPQCESKSPKKAARRDVPDAIRFPTRVARISAFAQYSLTEWETLPRSRAHMLIDDAEVLVRELDAVRKDNSRLPHDRRLAGYMYIETLRSIGHIELVRVTTEHAGNLYSHGRPTGLKSAGLENEGYNLLKAAIGWMEECEQIAPTGGLYYDLAESYLLLRQFTRAQGYARHAVLDSDPRNEREIERAYYIAAESFFLQEDTDVCKAQARKYAEAFKGTVTLEQFKSLRADLGSSEAPRTTAVLTRAA